MKLNIFCITILVLAVGVSCQRRREKNLVGLISDGGKSSRVDTTYRQAIMWTDDLTKVIETRWWQTASKELVWKSLWEVFVQHGLPKADDVENKKSAFGGLYPIVFTPMDHAGNINVSVIPAYAKYLHECGLDGAVVADIPGEGPSLSIAEKKKLFSAWMIAGKPLGLKIIGVVGGTPGPEVIELAQFAETISIDAIFVYPQPYISPNSPEQITNALKDLSSHVPSLPLFYNHCPDYTGLDVHVPTLFKYASEKVPQFKGIALEVKLAVTIIAVNKLRKDQNLFISNSIAAGGGTLMGFDAFNLIVLNLFPELIQDIIKLTSSGDVDKAKEEQRRLNTLVATITNQGDYIASQKAAMEIITGLPLGKPRAPIEPIPKDGLKNIIEILKECGIKIYK